jgi:hypothetical protein
MALIPVAPTISSVTPYGYVITINPDGNAPTAFRTIQVIYNSTLRYVDALGMYQTQKVFLPDTVTSVVVSGAIPNTMHAISLSAADDSVGTNETNYGPAAAVVTLATTPIAMPFVSVYSTTAMAEWNVNNNPTGTNYLVELSTNPGFLSGVISSGYITTVGYQFTGLSHTTIYYGRVKARSSALDETPWVSLGSITTLDGPDTVKYTQALNLLNERGNLIEWSPNLEPNVVSYNVYRSSSPTDNGEFRLLGTTSSYVRSYIDHVPFSFGIVYYYKVTAVDDGGNESDIIKTSPVHNNTYHSFEEQPFPTTFMASDLVSDEEPVGDIFVEGPSSQEFTMMDPPDQPDIIRVQYLKF